MLSGYCWPFFPCWFCSLFLLLLVFIIVAYYIDVFITAVVLAVIVVVFVVVGIQPISILLYRKLLHINICIVSCMYICHTRYTCLHAHTANSQAQHTRKPFFHTSAYTDDRLISAIDCISYMYIYVYTCIQCIHYT